MPDNIPVAPASGPTLLELATDQLATVNGEDVSTAIPPVHVQRSKMTWGTEHTSTDVDEANPLPVNAGVPSPPDSVSRGTAPAVADLNAGDLLHSILVIPTPGGQVTVTVLDQPADELPADLPYSEDFKGLPVQDGQDVVITGQVSYWRVTYTAAPSSNPAPAPDDFDGGSL